MRKGFQTLSMVRLIAKTDIKAKVAIDTAHVHCFNPFITGALPYNIVLYTGVKRM
jgi:hypothetical protein